MVTLGCDYNQEEIKQPDGGDFSPLFYCIVLTFNIFCRIIITDVFIMKGDLKNALCQDFKKKKRQ